MRSSSIASSAQRPDWDAAGARGPRRARPGCDGVAVLPFVVAGAVAGRDAAAVRSGFRRSRRTPGRKFRASLEALAYLIALGVREHEAAGQKITRITVSGGIARSDLMCEILATVLDRPLERLQSFEGPALGAAVTALAALETHLRRQQRIEAPFTVADAVAGWSSSASRWRRTRPGATPIRTACGRSSSGCRRRRCAERF